MITTNDDSWIYGMLLHQGEITSCIMDHCGRVQEVYSETVGQKIHEANDMEFFIGDVVICCKWKTSNGDWEVKSILLIKELRDICMLIGWDHYKLLGNIHDSPELRECLKQ